METKDTIGKDMMLKLKESFSLKSFSSKSYHSSLIRNSKTIRINVNLVEGAISNAFSHSNSTAGSSGNASKKKREATSRHETNLENPAFKNKSDDSSIMKKSSKRDKIKQLLKTKDSIKTSTEEGTFKLKSSVKHSHQVKVHSSINQIDSEAKPDCSKFSSFRCDVCMKYFSSKRNVRRHSILHSNERHPCETCGKVFQTKENLRRHCRVIHEAKVKSIKCSKCYKAYSRKRSLDIHLKKHPDHV